METAYFTCPLCGATENQYGLKFSGLAAHKSTVELDIASLCGQVSPGVICSARIGCQHHASSGANSTKPDGWF